jgi:chemotaxis protein methyltransferase CheR
MLETNTNRVANVKLLMEDFNIIAKFIHSKLGIQMPVSKKSMIETRLKKRLYLLKLDSYSKYCDFLFSKKGMGQELHHFIDVITTNKTDFFREPKHFDFIAKEAIPELIKSWGGADKKKLKVWSTACSRGDEPYTISMVLNDLSEKYQGFDYSIVATDISRNIIDFAVKGVYDESIIEPVPYEMRKKYLLRSKDKKKKLIRICPDLRRKVNFRQLNLISKSFGFNHKMDIIFCRNVIIYFDKETTDKLILRLCNQLKKGGFLFMGHSEILDVRSLPLVLVASTVYKKI